MAPQVCISQPNGVSLIARAVAADSLDLSIDGGGLSARANVWFEPVAFRAFFRDAAVAKVPGGERLEYKVTDDFVLHATRFSDDDVLLAIDLLCSENDESDWHLNATIRLSVAEFNKVAAVVGQAFV